MMRSFGKGACVALSVLFIAGLAYGENKKAKAPSANKQAKDFARKFREDLRKSSEADVVAGIDKLVAFYNDKKVDDHNARDEILRSLSQCLETNDKVVIAHLLTKCGEMDDEALKIIIPVLSRDVRMRHPDEQIYGAALKSLRMLHSTNSYAIKTLTNLLHNKNYGIIAATCHALTGYAKAPGRVRKHLFEEVLKNCEGVYSGYRNNNQTMKRKWEVMGEDAMDALKTLSGVDLKSPTVARQWFNKNKRRRWETQDKKSQ